MLKKRSKKHAVSESEFQLIYEMFYNRVYRDAYFMTKDPYLAQDILQDTFIKAYSQIHNLKDKDKIGAWLSTIATRTAIDHIRKQNIWNGIPKGDLLEEEKYIVKEISSTVEENVESHFVQEAVIEKILELKSEYREVILLKYIHELKEKDIAKWLNLKDGTVKSRLHRAKKELRNQIEKDTSNQQLLGGEIS
ncbi:RNA polymerase sigma factor [Aquibacillus kalidii]|uniref:RNA polymerase sigma factor n=1 Tax=Aquibacillus kalidii TaxID=2762597 RepID=UPI001646C619|nr:RNA polymerase sigma factor [Aquibacillus kalidii]